MLIGIAGKANVGKTSFFSAATLISAEISNRPFTTIKPNTGVAYLRAACACKKLSVTCTPKTKCINGTRFIPVRLIDVAGLVPDAHLGKGLGNQFLSDAVQADALIHVVDISGSTDIQGNACAAGQHDPGEDVTFFEKELDYWMLGIARKALTPRVTPKEKELIALLSTQLSGLGIAASAVTEAFHATQPDITSEPGMLSFVSFLRKKAKPMLIAANKIDVHGADALFERLASAHDIPAVPCSAEAELALRRAAEKGIIRYVPGDSGFAIVKDTDEKQKKALDFIRSVLQRYGSTGVQQALEKTVFELLGMTVAYPVENEHKLSDKNGAVLPDAFLMKRGATALDLAYAVHEDIGKKFIAAVDCRTHKTVSSSYELKDGDVLSIKAGR